MLSLQTVAEAWLHPGSRHLSTSSAVCPGWIYKSSVSALRMDGRGGTGQLSPSTPHYHIKHFYDQKCSWFPHIKRCPDTRWVFSNLTQFWHQLPSQHQILRLKFQSHKTASPPYPPSTSISDTNHKSRLTPELLVHWLWRHSQNHVCELSVNESETYKLDFPWNTHGFKTLTGKELGKSNLTIFSKTSLICTNDQKTHWELLIFCVLA